MVVIVRWDGGFRSLLSLGLLPIPFGGADRAAIFLQHCRHLQATSLNLLHRM
jgi:hypothetical protein